MSNLIEDVENLIHHTAATGSDASADATAETAAGTATEAAADPVKTVEEHVAQVKAWLAKLADESLPVVTAAASKAKDLEEKFADLEKNPVVKLVLEAALSPAQLTAVSDIVSRVVSAFGDVVTEAEHLAKAATAPAASTPAA